MLRSGGVVVGGYIALVDGTTSAHLAMLVPPCPAGTSVVGSGCTGAGGVNELVARHTPWGGAPWVGSPFVAEATGLPANGLAVAVLGVPMATLPLSVVTPLVLPGCDLATTPDVLGLVMPSAGAAEVVLAIPNAPSLVGATFRMQMVAIELSASAITAFTSSNALDATIGSY